MTLAIGPGTPAACVLPNVDADSDSSSEEEDDDEEEEGDDIFHAGSEDGSEDSEVNDNEEENMQEDEDSNNEGNRLESDGENAMELPSDAEEGQEYHFDDGGRLVKSGDGDDEDSTAAARQEAEAEIARNLGAVITQLPREQKDDEDDDEDEEDQPTGRSRWEKRQQSILDALNGVGNDDDDDMDESGNSHHTNMEEDGNIEGEAEANDNSSQQSAESNDSRGVTSRDRYNIRQVEQYIDHLESLHRRRERRANDLSSLSSPARDQGVYNESTRMYEREVTRSMKHGGCINTVSWLDCGWRVSTVSHEDAHPHHHNRYSTEHEGFISSSASYSSNNFSPQQSSDDIYTTPPRRRPRRDSGLVASLCPSEYPTQLLTSGDDHLVKFWDVRYVVQTACSSVKFLKSIMFFLFLH